MLFLISCTALRSYEPNHAESRPQWKFLGESNIYDFYIDSDSVRHIQNGADNILAYKMLTNGSKSSIFESQNIKSIITTFGVNCTTSNFKITRTTAHDALFGAGNIVLTSNEVSSEAPIKSHTITWMARNLFCDSYQFWND